MHSRRVCRRHMRRATALFTFLALAACSLGVPLPVRVEKSAVEPYPCQNCACGCANAEMCWRNCCCFSNEQKIAWASKNGVTPPAYVLAATKKPDCCKSNSSLATCCCSKPKKSCCQKQTSTASKNIGNSKPVISNVIILQALRCHGLTSLLTSLPPVVISDGDEIDFHPIPAGTVFIVASHYVFPLFGPDSPPPQLS